MRATDTAEIGRTGLHVTGLGLGGVALSGAPPATDPHIPSPESEAVSLIRRSLGLELNYLDTAPMYGVGHSERRYGPSTGPLRSGVSRRLFPRTGPNRCFRSALRLLFRVGYFEHDDSTMWPAE